jgi:hypothetical protein
MKSIVAIALSTVLSAGVIAANQLAAQTTGTTESGVPPASTVAPPATSTTTPTSTTSAPPSTTTTTTPTTTATPPTSAATADGAGASVPLTPSLATVQNVVEITRVVPSSAAPVTAFTVPAGVVLVVTDLIVTNTGTTATCGGAVNRSGTATPSVSTPTTTTPTTTTAPSPPTTVRTSDGGGSVVTTPVAGTITQTDSTVTGPLCVPAQTTTTLPLTTGIEFAGGQSVQLLNAPDPAVAAGTAIGSLGFHLRGLLVTLS